MSDQTQPANVRSEQGTAVVTGASSGIGKVYADRLAQRGYDLMLVARRADRLEALARDLRQRDGVNVQVHAADLGNAADLEKVVQAIGGNPAVTLLVNNAGVVTMGAAADAKTAEVEAMIHVNVLAPTRLAVAVLPGFKERHRGAIINVGSVLGFHGYPGTSIYSGTKAYLLNFTRGLQSELADTPIVVQLVAPAGTATEGWDSSTVAASLVMTAEDCVDASLKGLDLGEKTTMPSLDDLGLLARYDAASSALMAAAQTGTPATRYALAH